MPSGIYALIFTEYCYYVGKSTDVERRWRQHYKSLESGKHTGPLQEAYSKYRKLPETRLLLEVHPDLLDEYEGYYIHKLCPPLNTQIPAQRSEEDYKILEWYMAGDNTTSSVPDLLRYTRDLKAKHDVTTKQLAEGRAKWSDLVQAEIESLEGYTDLRDELRAVKTTLGRVRGERDSLLKFRDRVERTGWWGRLWAIWAD